MELVSTAELPPIAAVFRAVPKSETPASYTVTLRTSPGPIRSVGCGGMTVSALAGITGGGGNAAGLSTSTSVKG